MTSIAVVTATFAPDYELCVDLHKSMLQFTEKSVVHYLLVSSSDLELFKKLSGPRCVVMTARELLPHHMIWIPPWVNRLIQFGCRDQRRANLVALNPLRPIPPVRGWIMQQILKLASATRLSADVLLLADSDVKFVRPITVDTFVQKGKLRFYRRRGSVDAVLPTHVAWHQIAHKLLGLPPPKPPLPDYVSAFNVWDRRIVLALLGRIERVSRHHWTHVIGGQLSFSEHMLYGVFVDEVLGTSADVFATDSSLCHSYWDTSPLDAAGAAAFLENVSADDVAILIQSKSGTPLDIRRAALESFMRTIHD